MRFILVLFALLPFGQAFGYRALSKLPTIDLLTLYDKRINTSFLKNGDQPVVLITWAAEWCGPCVSMLDRLNSGVAEWEEQYGLKFIALNVDNKYETADIRAFTEKRGWQFEIYLDKEQKLMSAFNHNKAPLILFMDGDLNINYTYDTYSLEAVHISGALENIGKETQYYDDKWMWSSKERSSFYRTVDESKGDGLVHVADYFNSGQKQMEGTYLSLYPEVQNGDFVWYQKNGTITKKVRYEKGKYNGLLEEWTNDGVKKTHIEYKMGIYHGACHYFWPNGDVWSKQEYNEGKLWNVEATYDASGNLVNHGTIENGNGTYISYSKNGNIEFEVEFQNGLYHGTYTGYDPNGKPGFKRYFKEGKNDFERELNEIADIAQKAFISNDFKLLKPYLLNRSNLEIVLKAAAKKENDDEEELLEAKNEILDEYLDRIRKELKEERNVCIQEKGVNVTDAIFERELDLEDIVDDLEAEIEFTLTYNNSSYCFPSIELHLLAGRWIIMAID